MTEHAKRRLLIAVIILSLVPSAVLFGMPNMASLRSSSLWLSAVVGYMGIVLLLWMYILGARGVMSLAFTDLAPVLKIHKWLGKYGTLAIFLHPILITYSYSASWLYSFIPKVTTQSGRHILLGQIALWLLILIWITSALVRSKISWRTWRYLHWLAYISIPFALLHVPDLGSQITTRPIARIYFFSLFLAFCMITLLRLRSMFNLDKAPYEVTYTGQLTTLDSAYILKPSSKEYVAPKRGQYVYVKLGFLSEDHPFSVAQYNEMTHEITLAYRKAGMFTKEMQKIKQGQKLYVSGPYGSFTEDITPQDLTPIVYIAGGIGITPFVDRILRENNQHQQWLFAANRDRSLAVMYAPLKAVLGDRAIAVYNKQDGVLEANEEIGFISADLLRKYLGDPTQYRYYLCGPPPMMNALHKTLESMGVDKKRVKNEEFGW